MAYVKTVWVDDQAPAIDSINLNHIEEGIGDAHSDIDKIVAGTTIVGHAATADVATSLASGLPASVPIGAMLMWPSLTVPVDYMECNGGTLPRTHGLFAVIGTLYGAGDGVTTFNIPDMRGVFTRGWDHGRGVDAGRALGTYQDDALQQHTHTEIGSPSGAGTGYIFSLVGSSQAETSGVNGARVAYETRPKNIAIIFIIKVS